MPTIYEDVPDEVHMIPLDKIKSDLDLLQHALFTDPKDQSSWNYHEWLISLILPIQVVAISGSKQEDKIILKVGLSHKVRDFDRLVITVVADGASVEHTVTPAVNSFGASQREITEVWDITFPECKQFALTIAQTPTDGKNISAVSTAQTIDGIRIFRSFQRSFIMNDTLQMQPSDPDHFDVTILDQELARLKELNQFESGL
jgi:hypothetical protein